jgi:hypothetical protein
LEDAAFLAFKEAFEKEPEAVIGVESWYEQFLARKAASTVEVTPLQKAIQEKRAAKQTVRDRLQASKNLTKAALMKRKKQIAQDITKKMLGKTNPRTGQKITKAQVARLIAVEQKKAEVDALNAKKRATITIAKRSTGDESWRKTGDNPWGAKPAVVSGKQMSPAVEAARQRAIDNAIAKRKDVKGGGGASRSVKAATKATAKSGGNVGGEVRTENTGGGGGGKGGGGGGSGGKGREKKGAVRRYPSFVGSLFGEM